MRLAVLRLLICGLIVRVARLILAGLLLLLHLLGRGRGRLRTLDLRV